MIDNGHNFFIRIQNSGNFILVKEDVGKPKPQLRSLPTTNHTYGKKTPSDKESAKDLIYTWSSHKTPPERSPEKNYKKLNMLSLKQKITRSRQLRQFHKTASIVPLKKKTRHSTPDISFGLAVRPSTPMRAILSNFYGDLATRQKHSDYASEVTKLLRLKTGEKNGENPTEKTRPCTTNIKLLRRRSIS